MFVLGLEGEKQDFVRARQVLQNGSIEGLDMEVGEQEVIGVVRI